MNNQNHTFSYRGNYQAEDLLGWALEEYSPRIALACSFQTTVLVHMVKQIRSDVRVFAIDTGRLNEETYECARDVERALDVKIEWYFPKHQAVEALVSSKGMFSFKEGLDARRECCGIRKVEPLNRALSGLDAWITGIRRDQGDARKNIDKIEIDDAHAGIVKINPIADWSPEDIRKYVTKHRLPYNLLLEQGYGSVGCECCTRPLKTGESTRAGRWWWEDSEQKECGLHVRNWNI